MLILFKLPQVCNDFTSGKFKLVVHCCNLTLVTDRHSTSCCSCSLRFRQFWSSHSPQSIHDWYNCNRVEDGSSAAIIVVCILWFSSKAGRFHHTNRYRMISTSVLFHLMDCCTTSFKYFWCNICAYLTLAKCTHLLLLLIASLCSSQHFKVISHSLFLGIEIQKESFEAMHRSVIHCKCSTERYQLKIRKRHSHKLWCKRSIKKTTSCKWG